MITAIILYGFLLFLGISIVYIMFKITCMSITIENMAEENTNDKLNFLYITGSQDDIKTLEENWRNHKCH
jgi:hypothetical protein